MRAIARFTLEKHHLTWCSSGFAFVFWPFEFPVDVLEFCLWNKLKYCLCISVLYQRNVVSSTISQGVGSASASWVLNNIKVVNYCTVIELGFLTWVLLLPVYLLHRQSRRTVTTMQCLCMKYLARGGLDTGRSTKKWWEGTARYKAGAAGHQPDHCCASSAVKEKFWKEFERWAKFLCSCDQGDSSRKEIPGKTEWYLMGNIK